MRKFFQEFLDFFRKGDMLLLALCLLTTIVGVVIVASATHHMDYTRFIIVQIVAAALGVFLYAVISSIDLDLIMEYRVLLVLFNCVFLLMLIPFGVSHGGNRSWLDIPGLPFEIQVAEILKTTYILIMASVMSSHQNRLSKFRPVMHMVFHLGLLCGLNMVLSKDAGVSLIFVFIFIGMTFAGGVSLWWFTIAIGGIAAALPILWQFLGEYQRERILILIDPNFDAQGIGARYHSKINLLSLTGGGLTGQGLFNGNRTQGGHLFAQHTDYIFSSIGEEMGFFGCMLIIIAELAIIARCIYVGSKCPDYMRRLVCYGAASALMFQILINVGMCIGVMPVIGLTLPLISYGPSSVVSIFGMLGLVSGAYARPQSLSHERYVQPYRVYR